MSSLNSLEKLIQIATMEQMYLMLQKMKNDFPSELTKDLQYEVPNISKDNTIDTVNKIQILLNETVKKTDHSLILMNRLVEKINSLEREISAIKHDSEMNNTSIKQLETHVKGQQKLTDYVGFKRFSQQLIEEEHIKLKIEEKQEDAFPRKKDDDKIASIKDDENVTMDQEIEIEDESEEEVQEESEEEQEEEQVEVQEESEEEEESEEVQEESEEVEEEQVAEEQVEEVAEEEQVEEEEQEQEEESEEEVVTDDEDSGDTINNSKQTLETSVEDDEEEVFEIEIDDVTYFATSDENGILYEVTEDGEVGSKVGIIKDGEPIFS